MRYNILKQITILTQVLGGPVGIATGVMLAEGQVLYFILGLLASSAFAWTQAQLWWRTMEKMPKADVK